MKQLYLYIAIIITGLGGCSSKKQSELSQSIILCKDKDGLYQYNPLLKQETLIFKLNKNQVFVDELIKKEGKIIRFGYFEKSSIKLKTTTKRVLKKIYLSLNTNNYKSIIVQKETYTYFDNDFRLLKHIENFDTSNNTTAILDTVVGLRDIATSYKGIVFNDTLNTFFSKVLWQDKAVYSSNGNLYIVNQSDTSLLVAFNGIFDLKFGSGFLSPSFSKDGSSVFFSYFPGLFNTKEKPALKKISLDKKRVSIIKEGVFYNSMPSHDGNFILFKRDGREGSNKSWIYDIYILDIDKNKEEKIGSAYSACWQ